MSVTNEELRVKLLDARKAESELRGVRKELEHTTGATEKQRKESQKSAEHAGIFSRTAGGLKSALGYSAGLIGLGAVGYGLKDVVQGGIQAQEQQVLLQNSLKDTGQQGAKHLSLIQNAIDRTSTHGGFSALEETEGIAQLIRRSKSATEAVKLNAEAVTFARGAHMSYATSLRMVSQIQTGNTGRLQKYLGIIQPVKYYVEQLTKAEKKRNPEAVKKAELLDKEATAQEANRRVLERYGGAVKSYNNTAAGSVNNAKNAIELLERNLGRDFLPMITEGAKDISNLLVEIEEGHGVWKTLGEDTSVVAKDLKTVWEWVEKSKTAVKGLEIGLGFLAAAWGVEKVLAFYNAIKSLTLISTITGAVRGLGGAEAAGGAAGAEVGGASMLMPYLAIGVAALYAAHKLHLFGENLGEKSAKGEKASPKRVEELRARYYLDHPFAAGHGVTGLSGFNKDWLAKQLALRAAHPEAYYNQKPGEGQTGLQAELIKAAQAANKDVNLYMDGKLVAHIIGDHAIHDPKVARKFAEGTTKHVLAKKARE